MVNPNKVAFVIFNVNITWSSILFAVACIAAILVSYLVGKRKKVSGDEVINMCLWSLPLGLIGARLAFILFNMDAFMSNPLSMLHFWDGGLSAIGAVAGGILGIFIYSRIKKRRFLLYTDTVIPGLTLAIAIISWVAFFNQTRTGIEIYNPAHLWFPLGVRIDATMTYHYATFIYESICCFLIFVLLLACGKRYRHDGDALLVFVSLYSFVLAAIEPLRLDSILMGNVRITQIIYLAIFVLIVLFFIIRAIRERKLGETIWPKPAPVLDTDSDADAKGQTSSDTDPDSLANLPTESDIPEFHADEADLRSFGIDASLEAPSDENENNDKNNDNANPVED